MKLKKTLLILVSILTILGCSLSELPSSLWSNPTPTTPAILPSQPDQSPLQIEPAQPTPEPPPVTQPSATIELAEDALFAGDYDLALEKYSNAMLESDSYDIQAAALLGLARTKIKQGDCITALEDIQRIINDFSDSYQRANAQYFLGECLESQDNFIEAAEAYKRYLDFRPGLIDTLINEKSGDAFFSAGNFPEAISAFNAAIIDAGPVATNRLKIKIARSLNADGNQSEATRLILELYDSPTSNDYDKAAANLLLGQIYLSIAEPEQAYARFKDSVEKFPLAYDSYSGLIALIDAGIEVDDYHRGLVDYYAGQYGLAIDSFNRGIINNPDHEGAAHHYNALSYRLIDQPEEAILEWDALINDHPGDPFWISAWDEKAYTQWAYLDRFTFAAETLLSFVRLYPTDNHAPEFLFEAGRIYERNNDLVNAAATWERVLAEYPSAAVGYRSLFLAGISYYRLANYSLAQTTFQRAQVLSTTPEDQSASLFWVGKTLLAQNLPDDAKSTWEQASQTNPTGYYSERALQLLDNRLPFNTPDTYDLAVDLAAERFNAEDWMRKTFSLGPEVALSGLGNFSQDTRFLKGNAYWELGLYELASNEMESLRADFENDPVETFLLIDQFLGLGLYHSAIFASRQVMTLANLDDAGTLLDGPAYFNHIRFGVYFRDYVMAASQEENIHPLLLASLIRQESMFEGFVESSAGARGIMQILPATGEELATNLSWPTDFTLDDLYRPSVSIKLGAYYLRRQIDFFDGDIAAGLAAYNGGATNTNIWRSFANNDQDLFLEVIRFEETRNYLMQISDFINIYSSIYERNP